MNIEQYMDLFVQRNDVFAQQQASGAYYPVLRELTTDEVAEHLAGFASYGTYVIEPNENSVKYVVFDLDTYDMDAGHWLIACCSKLVTDLEPGPHGKSSLLLEDSGGKGYHIWLFFSEPIPAQRVRRWLGWAFWPEWLDKASEAGWPLEVFPKQDVVDGGGYGNLVKLPLGKHAVSGNRSTFIDVPGWSWATPVDSECRPPVPLDVGLVPALEPAGTRDATGPSGPDGITRFACVNRILSGDVPAGYRDEAMYGLALHFHDSGIEYDLALEMCNRVNAQFEKPMRDREVKGKVDSAFKRKHHFTCSADFMRNFCPSCSPTVGAPRCRPDAKTALDGVRPGDLVLVEAAGVSRDNGKLRITLKHEDAANTPTLVVG